MVEAGAPEPMRILLVRGNGQGQRMKLLLEAHGFVVQWVQMLAEANVVLDLGKFRPHAIVLDTELPDSEGLPTAIAVIKHARGIPIVSLCDDDQTEQRILRKGVEHCIPRSVARVDRVIHAIHGCIGDHTPIPRDIEHTDAQVDDMVNKVRSIMEG